MKTQLLEDIGESAAGNSNAGKGAPAPAPARTAPPARSRAAIGVWRQRLASEPPVPTAPVLNDTTPLELEKVFGEIAALEAQLVSPEPPQALPLSQAASPNPPGIAPAEPAPASDRAITATAPQDPFFDFTPPALGAQVTNPFTPPPTGLAQSRKRPPVWAACALSVALLIWGVGYLVQEHNDAGSLALVASQVKGEARVGSPSNVRSIPAPASRAQVAADAVVPPTGFESTPLPAVPPLVMLEPDPPPAAKPKPAARLAADREEWIFIPKTVRAAKQVSASPLPKPSIRKTRERSAAAPVPPKERRQRDPVRKLARAPVVVAERPPMPDTSMEATLKACREHGYQASQCIRRQCSVGTYGFVCRGR